MKTLTGQCRCCAVTYAVADAFDYAVNCHCSNCRRATTGAAFKPLAGIPIGRIAMVAGAGDTVTFGDAGAPYIHCRLCGSLLYAVVKGGTVAHVPMGTLVDAPSVRPTAHVFVGSKAAWFEITDGLPQFQASIPAG